MVTLIFECLSGHYNDKKGPTLPVPFFYSPKSIPTLFNALSAKFLPFSVFK